MILKRHYRSLSDVIKHFKEEVSSWGDDRGEAQILDLLLELQRFRELSGVCLDPDSDRETLHIRRPPRSGLLGRLADEIDDEIDDALDSIFPCRRRRR